LFACNSAPLHNNTTWTYALALARKAILNNLIYPPILFNFSFFINQLILTKPKSYFCRTVIVTSSWYLLGNAIYGFHKNNISVSRSLLHKNVYSKLVLGFYCGKDGKKSNAFVMWCASYLPPGIFLSFWTAASNSHNQTAKHCYYRISCDLIFNVGI